jgi:hypothetical protein
LLHRRVKSTGTFHETPPHGFHGLFGNIANNQSPVKPPRSVELCRRRHSCNSSAPHRAPNPFLEYRFRLKNALTIRTQDAIM